MKRTLSPKNISCKTGYLFDNMYTLKMTIQANSDIYVSITRPKNISRQLLVGFVTPFNNVKSDTL